MHTPAKDTVHNNTYNNASYVCVFVLKHLSLSILSLVNSTSSHSIKSKLYDIHYDGCLNTYLVICAICVATFLKEV